MRELLNSLTYRELMDWYQYYSLEPWGEERADWRIGQLSALTANLHRDKKHQPLKPSDFMLKTRPADVMTPKQIRDRMMAFARPKNG